MNRSVRPIFLCILMLLLLVGCTPAEATLDLNSTSPVGTAYPDQNGPAANDAYPDPALPADQSGADSAYPAQAVDPAEGNVTESTPVTSANQLTPTPRAELEASDPTGFALASGDLQLVEFFAFW